MFEQTRKRTVYNLDNIYKKDEVLRMLNDVYVSTYSFFLSYIIRSAYGERTSANNGLTNYFAMYTFSHTAVLLMFLLKPFDYSVLIAIMIMVAMNLIVIYGVYKFGVKIEKIKKIRTIVENESVELSSLKNDPTIENKDEVVRDMLLGLLITLAQIMNKKEIEILQALMNNKFRELIRKL